MIDIKKKYRTRDGRPVTLISDQGKWPYNIIGYRGSECHPVCWHRHGNHSSETSGSDLVEVQSAEEVATDAYRAWTGGDCEQGVPSHIVAIVEALREAGLLKEAADNAV